MQVDLEMYMSVVAMVVHYLDLEKEGELVQQKDIVDWLVEQRASEIDDEDELDEWIQMYELMIKRMITKDKVVLVAD